jgi:uncharacterized membrane protein YedE/YeeE
MVGATSAATVSSRPRLTGLAPWLGAGVALGVLVVFWDRSRELAIFWAIGLSFGIILQRSRLCFAGAFRDLFLTHDTRTLRAILLSLMVASVGFWLLMVRLVPNPAFGDLPPGAHVTPVGLHLVVGGVLFGIGMVLAGGCVSGTLFRIGEGYLASVVALVGILGGLSLAAHSWNWWWQNHLSAMPTLWLPALVGHGGALALTILALSALYLLASWWELRAGPPLPGPSSAPALPAFSLRDHLAALHQRLLGRGWPVGVGAAALAVLNVFSFVFSHPLGVTGELSAWAERLTGLVGLSAGPLLGLDRLAGCNLALGSSSDWLTSSFALDAGVVAGSFLAALAAGEFKVRLPRRKGRYLQAVGGGVLMGYGAGIAIGCTIGAFFSALPSLALSGWLFGASLAAGAWLGTLVIKRLP